MYTKIVVPLDGSDLAESTLPHLVGITKGCQSPQVLLISVTEGLKAKVPGALRGEVGQKPGEGPLPVGTSFSGLMYTPDSRNT